MTAPLDHACVDTPFGDFHVLADERGVVRSAGFRDRSRVLADLPAELLERGWRDAPVPHVHQAVEAWLDGDFDALRAIEVQQPGGPFTQHVWATLRDVPAGEPVSYKELAAAAGRPNAMRAVGTACARNTIGVFVPCHRVIAAGGRLGSYGSGGLGMKAAMLAMEAGANRAQMLEAAREATELTLAPSLATPLPSARRATSERPPHA